MIPSYIKKINRGLEDVLEDIQRRYKVESISDSLFRHSREFILRGGKRIRPLLFILSYKGYTSKKSCFPKHLFTAAASLELFHDFMLIHDDVIDNSRLRRGRPTLHRLLGRNIKSKNREEIGRQLAIVAGDIVFACSIEALLSVDEDKTRKEKALRQLIEAAAYTATGEFLDVVLGDKDIRSLCEREVFGNYTLKTAKYSFQCPLLMGATLAGAKDKELKKLSRLGLCAGQAFQLNDDLLDLFGSQEVIGKPVMTDLSESKKTLLVLKAYEKLKGRQKKTLRTILRKEKKRRADLKKLRRLVIESGSYDYCIEKVKLLQKEAIRICEDLSIKRSYKRALRKVLGNISP